LTVSTSTLLSGISCTCIAGKDAVVMVESCALAPNAMKRSHKLKRKASQGLLEQFSFVQSFSFCEHVFAGTDIMVIISPPVLCSVA
jgi:hypothetical protein